MIFPYLEETPDIYLTGINPWYSRNGSKPMIFPYLEDLEETPDIYQTGINPWYSLPGVKLSQVKNINIKRKKH